MNAQLNLILARHRAAELQHAVEQHDSHARCA